MSRRRLVVAAGDDRVTIPLSAVVDVAVGNVPSVLRDVLDDAVAVGYRTADGAVRTALVEGNSDTMSRFAAILFRCVLNGATAIVKHPARIGGRVTDEPAVPARVTIRSKRVDFTTRTESFGLDVTSIVGFDRIERVLDGTSRPTLVVEHAERDSVVASLIATDSARTVNLLCRYLLAEYSQTRNEAADVVLSDPEKRVLVGVYATSGDLDFSQILDGDAAKTTNVLNSLRDKDLIEDTDDGISLTSRGRILVTERLEDVNA